MCEKGKEGAAFILNLVQKNLANCISLLGMPEEIEIKMSLRIKMDSILGVCGVNSFPEYTRNVLEKSKNDSCLVKMLSNNSIILSLLNLSMTVRTLVNLVDSQVFALEMSRFLLFLCGSMSGTPTTTQHKFWWVQRKEFEGDIFVKVVSVEAKHCDIDGIKKEFNPVEFKVDLLEYGVPSELCV